MPSDRVPSGPSAKWTECQVDRVPSDRVPSGLSAKCDRVPSGPSAKYDRVPSGPSAKYDRVPSVTECQVDFFMLDLDSTHKKSDRTRYRFFHPTPRTPRTILGPHRRLGPLGLGPTGPNPRGLEPAWVRLDASAPWVWALRAQTQGASNQRGSASTPRPLGFRPYGPKPKGPRTLRARLNLT